METINNSNSNAFTDTELQQEIGKLLQTLLDSHTSPNRLKQEYYKPELSTELGHEQQNVANANSTKSATVSNSNEVSNSHGSVTSSGENEHASISETSLNKNKTLNSTNLDSNKISNSNSNPTSYQINATIAKYSPEKEKKPSQIRLPSFEEHHGMLQLF